MFPCLQYSTQTLSSYSIASKKLLGLLIHVDQLDCKWVLHPPAVRISHQQIQPPLKKNSFQQSLPILQFKKWFKNNEAALPMCMKGYSHQHLQWQLKKEGRTERKGRENNFYCPGPMRLSIPYRQSSWKKILWAFLQTLFFHWGKENMKMLKITPENMMSLN